MDDRDVEGSIRRHPSSMAPPERHRRFGPWGIFASVVVAVVLAAGIALAFVATGGPSGGSGGTVGAQAPDFDLRSLNGRGEVRLSELRGRVVVVSFERPSCRMCVRTEGALDETWRRYRHMGVTVMGIRRDAAPGQATPPPSARAWPVLADPHDRTAQAYGVRDELETFVIDVNGKVVAALDGPVTVTALAAQLTIVLGLATTTRPVGTTEPSETTEAGEPTTPEPEPSGTTEASPAATST